MAEIKEQEESASVAIARKILEIFKEEAKTVYIKISPEMEARRKEVHQFLLKVEKAHRDAGSSDLQFGSAYPVNKLLEHLTEAYGKPISSTPLTPRKCKDAENFLEEKAWQEAESLETNMSFKNLAYS